MTSTTPHAPEHPLRCGNADAGNPAARSAILNTYPIAADPREQENFGMGHSIPEAAKAAPKTSPSPGSGDGDAPNATAGVGGFKPSSWPFNPDDVSPLKWWRAMPADHLGDTQHPLSTMENICLIEGRECLAGLHGDAATRIAVAPGSLPISEISLEVDPAMSVLTAVYAGEVS